MRMPRSTNCATSLTACTPQSRGGLRPALTALARRSPIPVAVDLRVAGRLAVPVEVAANYLVAEMLTNATKHANASRVDVEAETLDGALGVCVRDDGAGGADPAGGSGLVGLRDRVEAVGGTMTIHSPQGVGTTLIARLPLGETPPPRQRLPGREPRRSAPSAWQQRSRPVAPRAAPCASKR